MHTHHRWRRNFVLHSQAREDPAPDPSPRMIVRKQSTVLSCVDAGFTLGGFPERRPEGAGDETNPFFTDSSHHSLADKHSLRTSGGGRGEHLSGAISETKPSFIGSAQIGPFRTENSVVAIGNVFSPPPALDPLRVCETNPVYFDSSQYHWMHAGRNANGRLGAVTKRTQDRRPASDFSGCIGFVDQFEYMDCVGCMKEMLTDGCPHSRLRTHVPHRGPAVGSSADDSVLHACQGGARIRTSRSDWRPPNTMGGSAKDFGRAIVGRQVPG